MNSCRTNLRLLAGDLRRRAAFSLIEILVVVALLSVIVLGLLAMFTQTQRAFRTGITQSDVLASGRLVADMVARELEQMAPVNEAWPNFWTEMPYHPADYNQPFLQNLPGNNTSAKRTNLLHDLFFISRQNQDVTAIGYFVRVNDPKTGVLSVAPQGVGTLYRFELTTNAVLYSQYGPVVPNLMYQFELARLSEFRAAKVADGVAHFLVRAYHTNGSQIVSNLNTQIAAYYTNYVGRAHLVANEVEIYNFTDNAVPASVELELGILEDKTWQHYDGLPSATSKSNYLAGATGRTHLFRQRIPIRNVDPEAYR